MSTEGKREDEAVDAHDGGFTVDLDRSGSAPPKSIAGALAAARDPGRVAAVHATGLLDTVAEESFDRLARLAANLLGVPVALVSFVDADRQFFKSCIGLPEPAASARQTPLSHSFCKYVVATDEPLIVADAPSDHLVADNPAIIDLGVVAYLGIPLRDREGTVLGSFCAIDHEPRQWSERDVRIMEDLAGAATSEIALLQSAAAEQQTREEAERANRRLRQLLRAGTLLAETLDYEQTLQNIADLVVPEAADWCAVDLLYGTTVKRVALVTGGPGAQEAPLAAAFEERPRPADTDPLGQVLASGRTIVIDDPTPELAARLASDNRERRALERLGLGSVAIVPMRARGRTLGALTFGARSRGRYDYDERSFLEELAARCGLAMANARLYQERDEVARTLQERLLPPRLGAPSSMDAAARHHPARGGSEVGGDFYDLFAVPGERWMAVVGDVCGKGVRAAALAGLARHTVRGAALQNPEPREVLATLNLALLAEQGPEVEAEPAFCTVVCALVSPHDGGLALQIASAGHPEPVVVRADGATGFVGVSGAVLGILDTVELDVVSVELGAGDALTLYTDGVTEARSTSGEFMGSERLLETLAKVGDRSAEQLTRGLCDAAMAWQSGSARDDIAVLTLRAR